MANPKQQMNYRTKKSDKKKKKEAKPGKGASKKNYFSKFTPDYIAVKRAEKKLRHLKRMADQKIQRGKKPLKVEHGAARKARRAAEAKQKIRREKRMLKAMERAMEKAEQERKAKMQTLGMPIRASYEAAGLIKRVSEVVNPFSMEYDPEKGASYRHALAEHNINSNKH